MVSDLKVNMTLQGASGKTYFFNLFGYSTFDQLKNAFKPLAAIYVFSQRYVSEDTYTHHLLYLGQTSDLATRFDSHHKENEITAYYGNCIWIHVFNGSEKEREEAEKDILASYDFPCNEVNNEMDTEI